MLVELIKNVRSAISDTRINRERLIKCLLLYRDHSEEIDEFLRTCKSDNVLYSLKQVRDRQKIEMEDLLRKER